MKAKCQTKGTADTAPCNDPLTSVDEMCKVGMSLNAVAGLIIHVVLFL